MLCFLLALVSARCIHSEIQAKTEVINFPSISDVKTASDDEWVPLIVQYNTDALYEDTGVDGSGVCFETSTDCSEDSVLTSEKRDYIISMLDDVTAYIKKFFKVHNSTLLTYLSQDVRDISTCGEISNIGTMSYEQDVGLVMFVTAHPISSSGVLAYAAKCRSVTDSSSSDGSKRSVFGYTNIVPDNLETLESKRRINVHTIMHETFHAMGFSGYTETMTLEKGTSTESVPVITTPKVLEVARSYFGDDSITYVEFEDGGGSGTAGAHWEKRILYNEIMAGTSSLHSSLSNFTLAYFEDLGVYKTDMSVAEPMYFGKGMGKDFYNCTKWPSESPYYGENANRGCTPDRGGIGICDIYTYTDALDDIYQNYGSEYKGGRTLLMDYCIHTSLVSGGQCYTNDLLSTETVSSLSFLDRGSTYGSDSRCFTTSLMKYSIAISDFSCYRIVCVDRGYRVLVGEKWMLCTEADEEVEVTNYNGKLTCAPVEEFCGEVEEWPDVWKVSPSRAKTGDTVSLIGKYLTNVTEVSFGDTSITDFTLVNDGEIQIVIKFEDAIVNVLELLDDGYVTVDVMVSTSSDVNAVFVDFELELEFAEIVSNFFEWLYKNLFFTIGCLVILSFVIFLFGFIVTKRIVRRRQKQLARGEPL
ncbi:Cell surface protease gp63 [Entamoeba marina]